MTSWPDHRHPAIKNDCSAILRSGIPGLNIIFVIAVWRVKEAQSIA